MEKKNKRVNIQEILDDPELRKDMMINALIACQAREGRDLQYEEAEEVYEKIQEEKRKRNLKRR